MKDDVRKIIMVLLLNKKLNIFTRVYCFLIFTDEEIVVANFNKESETKLLKKWQDENRDSEYALTERDFRKCLYKYGQKYYDMSTEDILMENERNFSLSHADIKRMGFKAAKKPNNFAVEEVGTLTIQTTHKRLKFTHYYRDWNRNIYTILAELYGSRLKYKGGDKALSPVFKDGREGFH